MRQPRDQRTFHPLMHYIQYIQCVSPGRIPPTLTIVTLKPYLCVLYNKLSDKAKNANDEIYYEENRVDLFDGFSGHFDSCCY